MTPYRAIDDVGKSVSDELTQIRERRAPPYVKAMCLLTGTYLAFELGFNARLLDVAGGLATSDEISSIEHWGRYISGVALAVAIWGSLLKRGNRREWPLRRYLIVLPVWGIASIAFAYNGEKALIDYLVDYSKGESRQIAAELTLFSHEILEQRLKIEGIDLGPDELAKPAGKSFIALFPVLTIQVNNITEIASSALRKVISINVAGVLGTRETFYNETYLPSLSEIQTLYNDKYRLGVNNLNHSLAGIPKAQDDAWAQYLSDLRNNRLNVNNIPPQYVDAVRNRVKQRDIPVPNDWRPNDRNTFYAAIREKITLGAQNAYQNAITQYFGAGAKVRSDLRPEDFVADPLIQKKWHDALNRSLASELAPLGILPWEIPKDVELHACMTVDSYSHDVYEPLFDYVVNQEVNRYTAATPSFSNGGANEEFGKKAMEALLVPPIALGFSLLGALVHITKFSYYSLSFRFYSFTHLKIGRAVRLNLNLLLALFAVGSLAFAASYAPNEVTTSRVYDILRKETALNLGSIWPHLFTWVIQAQPYAYPFNELERRVILMNASFGYSPPANEDSGAAQKEIPTPRSGSACNATLEPPRSLGQGAR